MLTTIVETSCGQVEYFEAGAGEPVLYFHGTGVTGDVMVKVERQVVDDGFRLIVSNRPGYGKTPLAEHCSAVDCASVAAALLDALRISSASVMGSSGGAAFATAFAINQAQRTKSLVLLCPQLHRWDHARWLPKTSRWTLPFLKRPFLRKLLLLLYRQHLPRMSVAQFLKTEAGDRYPDIADDPVAQELCLTTLAAMALGTRSAGFENDFVVFTNEDLIGVNCVVQPPTLILHDEKDPLAPVDHVDWIIPHCRTCERISLHAAGHLIWVGPEAELMHQIRTRFLREHSTAS